MQNKKKMEDLDNERIQIMQKRIITSKEYSLLLPNQKEQFKGNESNRSVLEKYHNVYRQYVKR